MTTRNTLLSHTLCALVLGLTVACGSSDSADDGPTASQNETWREQATEMNDLTCQRIYECFPPALLDAVRSSVPQTGNSVEECQQNMSAQNAAATAPCPSGQNFHSDLADQCLVALSDSTCQDFMKSLLTSGGPEPCSTVCS